LCGASKVITVDLNPYLKPELIMQDIEYLREHREEIISSFTPYSPTFAERFEQLVRFEGKLEQLLAMTNIVYSAPADATDLRLPSQSIDYHISYTVFEHIPAEVIRAIWREGRRLLKPDGLFIHLVDFSDHFSHSDPSITSVNFLRFSEWKWRLYAGNRYMYHNRLRIDDFMALMAQDGLQIVACYPTIDPRGLETLENGFPLAPRFRDKSAETNATGNAWIIAAPLVPTGNKP
jgi:SAM-dependent methyltransferase